jgi:hypothetical protein
VTLLVQNPKVAAGLMGLYAFTSLTSKGLRTWKDAVVTVDAANGTAVMRGVAWVGASTFGGYATTGHEQSIDLLGGNGGGDSKGSSAGESKGSSGGGDTKLGGQFEWKHAAMDLDEKGPKKGVTEVLDESVQELARQCGVTRDFTVGYADGKNKNCLIISVYKAANQPLSSDRERAIRTLLEQEGLCNPDDDIDLGRCGKRLLRLLCLDSGRASWELHVLQRKPAGGGYLDGEAHRCGRDPRRPIYLFFAGSHFSPALKV